MADVHVPPITIGDYSRGAPELDADPSEILASPAQDDVDAELYSAGSRFFRDPALPVASLGAAWNAGLDAWRRDDFAGAAANFESVAIRHESPWMVSAGAFWAARAYLANRQPEQFSRLLAVASDCGETFYGILARRILGLPMQFRWGLDESDQAALDALDDTPEGLALLAAMQDGRLDRAESMARSLTRVGQVELAHGAMVYAELAGLAQLAFRLERFLSAQGVDFDSAAYPIPRWTPEGGFTTDRALVYALMRQESNFNPRAVSPKGARGVMQLMPATARYVARMTGFSGGVRLERPEANIALGQRYIEYLLLDANVSGDLFRLVAAWNGGPGNLDRWQRRMEGDDDPLLFIESIPAGETRVFVERVIANLWIYRNRLGMPSPSLDALAAGQWPAYDAPEETPLEVAEHALDPAAE